MQRKLVIFLGVALPLAFMFWQSIGLAGQPKTKDSKAAPVTVGQALRADMPLILRAVGTVEASSVVAVKARVDGLLEKVHFQEGAEVKKGDTLFTIDSRALQAGLREARAALRRLEAELAQARRNAERNDKLRKKDAVSAEAYESSRTALASLAAQVEAARAAVESARVSLSYTRITSPIDGRAGALAMHAGNMVRANAETPMVTLYCISPVDLRFTVPEMYLARILRAQAKAPLAVRARPEGAEESAGRVHFIDSAVDTATGSIALKARFENAGRQLWPGQFAEASLELGLRENVVTVPAQAVSPGADGEGVYVVLPDSTVEYRVVTTIPGDENRRIVTSGLEGGETVVLDGRVRLTPGALVSIREARDGR